MSTLIKPLFVDGNYNREGKRIRAEYVKTISCEGAEYSLYISAGSAENNYPHGENDSHYLYALVGDYLIPCGQTEYSLEQQAGYLQLNKVWYGGDLEARRILFDEIRKGKTWEEGNALVTAKIAEEEAFIIAHKKDGQVQAEYLKIGYDGSISRWIDARDNGGRFADFVGAAFLGEIDKCLEVSARLKAERAIIDAQKRKEHMEKERKEQEEREQKELEAIQEAEKIMKDGGTIKEGKMIVKLADKHGISIPIRTRGWILDTFAGCTIKDNSVTCSYWKHKNGQGSQKIYDVIFDIRKALQPA
jgi:hypothetical protein